MAFTDWARTFVNSNPNYNIYDNGGSKSKTKTGGLKGKMEIDINNANTNIDLMIHPSFLWGNFKDMFVHLIAFRAIENGYTIIHCARQGNVAIISPKGRIKYKQNVNDINDKEMASIPIFEFEIESGTETFYSKYGFWFDDVILCLSVIMAVCIACQNDCVILTKKSYAD